MSVNQSRADKNEPPQYRRSGRSGNSALQRNFSGGGGKGGGGGSTAPPSSSSLSSNRSFKKVVNNAQGVHPRVGTQNTNVNLDSLNSSSTAARNTVQNGSHLQPPVRGTPDAPVTGAPVKSTDVSNQKSTPGLPKAPQVNAVATSSDATSTPVKGPTDASRAFPLQFGSISPGFMNGMQIPARTNSCPPNLDEQKQAQTISDNSHSCGSLTDSPPVSPSEMEDFKGATMADMTVTVTLEPEYQLPAAATAALPPLGRSNAPAGGDSALRKAEDVVTNMFTKGFILGKDAVGKAKSFDEKHQLTSTASAKVASFW